MKLTTMMTVMLCCLPAGIACPAQTLFQSHEQAPTVKLLDEVSNFIDNRQSLCQSEHCFAAFQALGNDVRYGRDGLADGTLQGARLTYWHERFSRHLMLVDRHLHVLSARAGAAAEVWSAQTSANKAIRAVLNKNGARDGAGLVFAGGPGGQEVNCNDLAAVLSANCGLYVVSSPVAAALCEAVVIEQWLGCGGNNGMMMCGEGPDPFDCCPDGDACDLTTNPTDGDDTINN